MINPVYSPASDRYTNGIRYRRCGRSGIQIPEMALAWCLKDKRVTSVIVGASSVAQLADNFKAIENTTFTAEELAIIDQGAARGFLPRSRG